MVKSAKTKKKESAPETNGVKMLTYEEGLAYFDGVARSSLGMSGAEFLKAWNEGKYKDVDIDTPEMMQVVMLLPFTVPPAEAEPKADDPRPTTKVVATAKTKKPKEVPHETDGVKMLTYEEGLSYFDGVARRYLGISGEEFLRAWNEGKYKDVDIDTPEIMRVVMLLPFTVPPEDPPKK